MGRNRLRQSKKARGSMIRRSTFREILGSMGRYLAILSIIALGVGFFTGLKITKTEMIATINEFIQEKNFYDFRLVSSLGFEQADVEAFRQEPDVRYAEGTYSFDALYSGIGERETALKTMSLPEHVNGIELVSGRMPVQRDECVIDVNMGNVAIGDQITLTDTNEADTLDIFKQRTFTVVGMVQSSYYINFERGTTSIGNGKVSGFVYMEPEVFDCDYYTEVFVRFDQDYEIYSQAYKDYIAEHKDSWETLCKQRGNIRYETLKDDAQQELSDARKKFEDQKADAIIRDIRDLLKSFKIKTYNEDTGYGLFRHVLIRVGHVTRQVMVVLVLGSPILPSKNNFVKALLKLHPEITTIVLNVNDKKTSMVLGDRETVLYGKGYIEDELCGCRFRISPKSFYQINSVQTEKLYAKAMELAGLSGKERVIDAY